MIQSLNKMIRFIESHGVPLVVVITFHEERELIAPQFGPKLETGSIAAPTQASKQAIARSRLRRKKRGG